MTSDSIENLSTETRTFAPSPEFTAQANAQADLYLEADKDRLAFWDEQAKARVWEKKWGKTLEWESPYAKWFVGGKLNATVSALDRHVAEGHGGAFRTSYTLQRQDQPTQVLAVLGRV